MKYEAGNRFNPDTYFKTEVDSTSVTVKVSGELEGVEVSFDSGDVPEITTLSVTENGTYEAPEGTAYDPVTVEVPNSYTAEDAGKVVVEGALVSQTSTTKTANGTYDTTTNNEVVVEVPNTYTAADEGKVVSSGALVSQTSRTVTANDTYDTTTNNEVVVAVPGPSGSINITQNDTYDVTQYASAVVNVSGGGGSSYTLLHEEDLSINIQSGTQVIKTVNVPGAYTSGSVIFVKVIDKAGFRNNYYYGSFGFSVNGNAGADSSDFTRNLYTSFKAVEYQNVHQYGQGNGWNSSGIFISKISSNDDVEISVAYNQNLGTMTGDYHIEIYKLDFPNNVNPFPLS